MADNMIYKDVFKCSNCGLEMDENYIGCPQCKEFGTIEFVRSEAVGPCECADCLALAERKKKHFNHPFYIDARKIWTNHQWAQIEKGAVKYPEPFTPSSWSNEELAEHAIQENVDQLHYIVGMKERMEQQQKEIERLNKENENQLHYINSARKDYSEACTTINELQVTNRALRKKVTSLENEEDFLQQIRVNQGRKILEMREKISELNKRIDELEGIEL